MTSKGVDYYFVNTSDATLNAEAKNTDGSYALAPISVPATPMITTGNCQITYEFPHSTYGSFTFSTTTSPYHFFEESINAVTGNTSGPLDTMMNTPSITDSSYALSYGMFDAGTGAGTGLTNQDQIYAYLTGSQQTWMGDLAAADSAVNAAPFGSFVLPGAHDTGTWDLTQVDTLCLSSAGIAALVDVFLWWIPGATIVSKLAAMQLKGVIVGEAVTQKDNITTMLNLGCRYFDFRPGYAPGPINPICNGIYHIHNVIPGQEVGAFFQDVLAWLVANPTEIVVVSLSTAGFYDHSTMDPSVATLQKLFHAAQQAIQDASSIQIGAASDLQTTYADLIKANMRLFFLNQNFDWYAASKYDSYTDAYQTTDPIVIMNLLNGMSKAGQANSAYTVLQFQATATGQNIVANVIALADSMSNAYEPLMSTKPMMDSNTYPWALDKVPVNLSNTQLLVLLNDFVDNALAGCVASVLTKQRCNVG